MTQPAGPIAALFDAVADVYETTGPVFFDHFGGLLVEHAGVRRSDRVLDLAAGSGAVSVPALAAAGPQGSLLAVDVSPAMVRRLSARLETTGHPHARAVVGDIGSLGPATGPVDVVLCGFALFFLPEPHAALQSWIALLRPGGRLAVSTWGREDPVFAALRADLADLGVDTTRRTETYDDAASLRTALEAVGLQEASVLSVELDLRLRDVDELLEWASTHGAWGWLQQLDGLRTARLRASLTERCPGPVLMTWQAHLASAARPPG